jgi:hypothetical protein
VSFFDEDVEPTRTASTRTRPRPRGGGGRGRADSQTLLVRRVVFGGVLVIFLLLLAVGVHSCQVSQRKNSLRDYNRQVTAIATESGQTGNEFFKVLGQNASQSPQDLQTAISGYRVQAEQQLKQAQGLDTPDQMKAAQQSLLIALELRRNALGFIAQRVRTALGDQGEAADAAINQIAAQMQAFNASDVLYQARVMPFARRALADNDVAGQLPRSRFLNDIAWLSPPFVASKLGQQLSNGGNRQGQPTGPGLHGTGLQSTAYGNTTLQPGTANHLTYQAGQAFTVTFTNQGDNDEFDIKVTVTITPASGGRAITLTRTVPKVAKGETAHANVALDRTPPIGAAVTIHVNVAPVPGEKKTDNNKSDYPAIFAR